MADVWVNSMACHPRATYHIVGCCHLVNSLSRFQSHMPHYRPSAILKIVLRHILFFWFLMQFRLWRAAAFVSSPIHLLVKFYNNSNNNNTPIYKAHEALASEALAAGQLWVLIKSLTNSGGSRTKRVCGWGANEGHWIPPGGARLEHRRRDDRYAKGTEAREVGGGLGSGPPPPQNFFFNY